MSQGTNRQYVGPDFAGTIDQSPTTPVFNLPPKNILRGGTVDASSISVLNIIGGFSIVIDTTKLTTSQALLLLASGGVSATVTLSNGGTIAGLQSYPLKPGNFLSVVFDGTNLTD
jgi:hypothetical protein